MWLPALEPTGKNQNKWGSTLKEIGPFYVGLIFFFTKMNVLPAKKKMCFYYFRSLKLKHQLFYSKVNCIPTAKISSETVLWGIPSCPVARTLCFHCRGPSWIPGWTQSKKKRKSFVSGLSFLHTAILPLFHIHTDLLKE